MDKIDMNNSMNEEDEKSDDITIVSNRKEDIDMNNSMKETSNMSETNILNNMHDNESYDFNSQIEEKNNNQSLNESNFNEPKFNINPKNSRIDFNNTMNNNGSYILNNNENDQDDLDLANEYFTPKKKEAGFHELLNNSSLSQNTLTSIHYIPDISISFEQSTILNNDNTFTQKKEDIKKTNIKIKSIFHINTQLNFSEQYPLWYIYNVEKKSSYGPVSSAKIVNLYEKKEIDSNTLIRPLDIFKLKNSNSNYAGYIELYKIEDPYFIINNFDIDNSLFDLLDRIKMISSFNFSLPKSKNKGKKKFKQNSNIKLGFIH